MPAQYRQLYDTLSEGKVEGIIAKVIALCLTREKLISCWLRRVGATWMSLCVRGHEGVSTKGYKSRKQEYRVIGAGCYTGFRGPSIVFGSCADVLKV